MTEDKLRRKFVSLTGLNDFVVIFKKEFNEDKWGEYLIDHKVILLYVLDEEGNEYEDDILEVEGIHELAHHIQYHHTEGFAPTKRTEHGSVFRKTFTRLLKIYYNGVVPSDIKGSLKERGYLQ